MEIDIAQVAASAVAILAPFTPFLLETGKTVGQKWAETVATRGGEAAWNKAKAIWEKIHSHTENDAKVKGAALIVSADPDDESAQTLLATALGSHLKQDPQLARELLHLVGGSQAVQEVLAERGSWIEEVTQQMKGTGTQSIKVSEDSAVKGVRQIKE